MSSPQATREVRQTDGMSFSMPVHRAARGEGAEDRGSLRTANYVRAPQPGGAPAMSTSLRSPLPLMAPSAQVVVPDRPEAFAHVHGQKADVDGRHQGWDFGARRNPSWSGMHRGYPQN